MLPDNHPYSRFIDRVLKPGRYTGGEFQQCVKDPDEVRCRVALAYPDVYEIGMSHMGLKILYSIVNGQEDLAAERCFAPWPDMEAQLREHQTPLVSLETATALRDFDLVGFSLQYELTYTNILMMLDLGGIPLRSVDRGEGDPLVIAGGPVAFEPEPLALFIDLFVIGDGEEALVDLMREETALREQGLPRAERLRRLAEGRTGRYVPSLYEVAADSGSGLLVAEPPEDSALPFPILRAQVAGFESWPFPVDVPVPETRSIFDRHAIELARGCTEGCRFCQAGMIYRPVRERSPRQVVETVMRGIREAGYDEVSLSSLSTADYSAIVPLVRELVARLESESVSLSVSSLRAYGLPESLLDEIARVRATSLTFAPEAGTQRLRDVINKNVREEHIAESARRVFSRDWNHMKLYFMIGLPTERREDIDAIVATSARCLEEGRRAPGRQRPARVTCSVSSFVPKPHTPFQWAAMATPEELAEKQERLRPAARRAKIDFRWHDTKSSWLEGIFSRGDRALADLLEQAYRLGCRFDSWDEHFRFDLWQDALAAVGLDPAPYLGELPTDARLPWDHIDPGVTRKFLLAEAQRSLGEKLSQPCSKPPGKLLHADSTEAAKDDLDANLVCYHCGVGCDLDAMKGERVSLHEQCDALSCEPRAMLLEEPKRYRLAFSKRGPAARISHLDMLRLWPRLLRRAGLAVAYSQGYHPHPRLSYTPALPFGMESLGEQIEMLLRVDITGEDLAARLAPLLPDGFEIGEVFCGEKKAMSKRLRSLRMRVEFAAVPGLDLAAACRDLLAQEAISVSREQKGRRREVETRATLLALLPLSETAVEVELALQGAALKAAELVDLLGADGQSARGVRLGFELGV